jgi:hypothetical protein
MTPPFTITAPGRRALPVPSNMAILRMICRTLVSPECFVGYAYAPLRNRRKIMIFANIIAWNYG